MGKLTQHMFYLRNICCVNCGWPFVYIPRYIIDLYLLLLKREDGARYVKYLSLESLHFVSEASMAILIVVRLIKSFHRIKLISTKCLAIVIGLLLFLLISRLPPTLGDLIVPHQMVLSNLAIAQCHMINDLSSNLEN